MCVDLSLGFLFCSIDLYFCLCSSTILSWWLWLCSRAWSQAGWFLQFHSSFSRLLWLFEFFLYFHTNLEIICSSSVKNLAGSLIGIALNLLIALGSILIFTIDSSDPWTWYISPSLSVLFDFFHQCFIVFCIQVFCLFR